MVDYGMIDEVVYWGELKLRISRKLLVASLIMSFGIFASASVYASEINVDVGFDTVEFRDQRPALVDGRTLVPIRDVFEHLGFHVDWHQAARAVTIVGNGNVAVIVIGSNTFTVNGIEHALDVPAQIIGGSTMLPLRAVLTHFGYYVGWNANTSTVQVSATPTSGIDHRPADNFQSFITSYAFLDWGIIVLEAEDNVLWATQFRTGNLMKSVNQGVNWTLIREFPRPINAIHADGHGNLFVATSLDRWAPRGSAELFKSTDGGQSFRHVLDIQSGAPMNWNIASQDGTMFVSEYGFKWLPNNARRIYRSLDFGETWTMVYEPPQTLDYHNHKILMTEDGIIYQSVGDGMNSQIKRSTDNGYTWTTAVYGFQPTSGLVFDDYILWGLDGGPWMGIARYDRQTHQMDQALVLPQPFSGPAYDLMMVNGIIYAPFLSYGGYSFPASIFFSEDEGHTWHLLGYIEKAAVHGVGLNHIVTDGRYAYIDIGAPIIRDGHVEMFRGTLRIGLLN